MELHAFFCIFKKKFDFFVCFFYRVYTMHMYARLKEIKQDKENYALAKCVSFPAFSSHRLGEK